MKILRSLTTTYTMNLLAKKFSFKNIIKPGLIMLIPVFFGCDTSEDIGVKYDLGTDANIRFQEFTLSATNTYIDSLRTDGETRILVGNYTDSLTGDISAQGYFQYFYERGPLPRQRDTNDQTFTDTLKLDSILVILESGDMIPNSGNTVQEFSLYELQDSLISSAIYLASLEQTTTNLAGTFTGTINPAVDTVHSFKLDDAYAQTFFNRISDIAGDTTQTIASTVFKSLGLVPGATSESITSIDLASDTTRLVMYMSPVDPEAKDTTYLTYFRFTGKHYTYLDRDRSSSPIASITEYGDFDLSSGETVIDPLAGVATAITLDGVKEFFDENPSILINNATLALEFKNETKRGVLPGFMNFFRRSDGRIFGPSTANNPFGNIVMADEAYFTLESSPAIAFFNEDEDKLLITSTLFYQQLYNQSQDSSGIVYQNPIGGNVVSIEEMVTISTADVILQRSIFKNEGIKLRLYYTEVER